MNGKANCGAINITQQQKGVSYWYPQQIGGNYAAWTKSISNGYILSDLMNITFLKWQMIGIECRLVVTKDKCKGQQ